MPITLKKIDAATVPAAPVGKVTQFVDTTGALRQKDENGNVSSVAAPFVTYATFAAATAAPPTAQGFVRVTVDETNGGYPTTYFYNGTTFEWIPSI